MLAVERTTQIMGRLRNAGFVSTDQLAVDFDVSSETIRRDLKHLESEGVLERVHGGARAIRQNVSGDEPAFAARDDRNHDAKAAIAAVAVSLIQPTSSVFIDIGTTCLAVARAIPDSFRGTVTTNSLHVAADLADRTEATVLVGGGRVRGGDLAVSSGTTASLLQDTFAEIAFLGSGGIDAEAGLTDYQFEEAMLRRQIIAHSRDAWVLADSSKFDLVARVRVAAFGDVSGVISDKAPGERLRSAIANAGALVLTPAD